MNKEWVCGCGQRKAARKAECSGCKAGRRAFRLLNTARLGKYVQHGYTAPDGFVVHWGGLTP